MGVVIRRWVWLECIGVVSGCNFTEVYRFRHKLLLIPTLLVLALFFSSILLFLKCFLFLFMLFLCSIANVAQRTFEILQKSKLCQHGDTIISTSTLTTCPETST